jgi:hypothetical protein
MSNRRSALDDSAGNLVSKMLGEASAEIARNEAAAAGVKLDGRGKPGGAGQKGQDKTGRAKASFDLSLPRQAIIAELAAAEGVAKSDLVELAIQCLAEAYAAGKLDFYAFRRPARSLRAEWTLDVPDKLNLF